MTLIDKSVDQSEQTTIQLEAPFTFCQFPPMAGWRAQWHVASRDRGLLIRLAGGLAAGGLALALLIASVSGPRAGSGVFAELDAEAQRFQELREEYRRLELAKTPQPRQLGAWLRAVALWARIYDSPVEDRLADFTNEGRIGLWNVRRLVHLHADESSSSGALMFDFILAALTQGTPEGKAAAQRLQTRAALRPPPGMANEFLATLHLMVRDRQGALKGLLVEGLAFPEAAETRESAVRLAVDLRDTNSLELMAAEPGWIENCPPALLHHAGRLLGNLRWQWRGLVHHQLAHFPIGWIALTLLTVGMWYTLLVLHTETRPWRWTKPIFPVMAGIVSIWPTLALAAYQEVELGLTPDAPFPHDLWYFLGGVGLREELAKLALVSLFIPWLLYRGNGGRALMTGAFVGLGFALEENLGYFQDYGSGAAWARFLTANFLHIALSALAGFSLYRMFRTRFGEAEQFIGTFLAVVLAHGVYDFLVVQNRPETDFASIIILALVANHFFLRLEAESTVRGATISPPAILLVGAGILIGTLFVLSAIETGSREEIAETGMKCLGLAPLIFIYWRRFEHHLLR